MPPIEVRFDKNINNLSLVREADPRRQWEYITVALLGGLCVVGLLFYGWQHFQFIQYGYRIEDAQKKKEQLEQKRSVLRIQNEQLKNLTRVESLAREMGMVPSLPGQLVAVNMQFQENSQPQLSAKK